MDKQKKKVTLFEKTEITDPDYAQKVYDRENGRFKLKLVCTGLALVASICGLIMVCFSGITGFLASLMGFLWLLGFVATVFAGALPNYFKIILNSGQTAYFYVSFVLIDIICFVLGATIGLMLCLALPIIPCGITLYQSYQNLKETKDFLALYNQENA